VIFLGTIGARLGYNPEESRIHIFLEPVLRLLRTFTLVLLFTAALLTTARAETQQNQRRHRARKPTANRRLKRMVWNPLFAGSHSMLVRQNQQLDLLELPRIANEEQLLRLEEAGALVPVPTTSSLVVASNLLENRRYARPWTRDFLNDLGEAYHREFGQPIVATSLVRTADQQKKLRRRNRNAAPQEGETASTHLTGVTVDLLKRGMTQRQHNWLENYFLPLKEAGLIEPIEERRQPVFHIVVFDTYAAYHAQKLVPGTDGAGDIEMQPQSAPADAPAVTEALSPAEAPAPPDSLAASQSATDRPDEAPPQPAVQVSTASQGAP